MTIQKLSLETKLESGDNEWQKVDNKKLFHLDSGNNVFCYIKGRVLIPFAEYHFSDNSRSSRKVEQNKVSKDSMYLILKQFLGLDNIDRVRVRGFNNDIPVKYITKDMLSKDSSILDIFNENGNQRRYNVGECFYLSCE